MVNLMLLDTFMLCVINISATVIVYKHFIRIIFLPTLLFDFTADFKEKLSVHILFFITAKWWFV